MRLPYAIAAVLSCSCTAFAEDGYSSLIHDRLTGLDSLLGTTVDYLATVLLFDFGTGVPLIVAVTSEPDRIAGRRAGRGADKRTLGRLGRARGPEVRGGRAGAGVPIRIESRPAARSSGSAWEMPLTLRDQVSDRA